MFVSPCSLHLSVSRYCPHSVWRLISWRQMTWPELEIGASSLYQCCGSNIAVFSPRNKIKCTLEKRAEVAKYENMRWKLFLDNKDIKTSDCLWLSSSKAGKYLVHVTKGLVTSEVCQSWRESDEMTSKTLTFISQNSLDVKNAAYVRW